MATKKDKIKLYAFLLFAGLIFLYHMITIFSLSENDVVSFVTDNESNLSTLENAILSNEDYESAIKVYENSIFDSCSLYKFEERRVLYKVIKKKYIRSFMINFNEYNENKEIIIFLKSPPRGYGEWGVYFSEKDLMLDEAGRPVECDDDVYVQQYTIKTRNKYESRRICTNWFFFKRYISR